MKLRSVFYGFDAYVGAVTGKTKVEFWADDPNNVAFDPAQRLKVDLALNPEACRQKKIPPEQVIVDDFRGYKLGGHSTIGPDYPFGAAVGGCWLEADYWNALDPAIKPPRVPAWRQCRPCEITSVYYWDGPMAYRRFYGFYAEINGESGSHALCTIWRPGTSLIPGQPAEGSVWIDLAVAAHPIEPGFTEIGVGLKEKKKGCLFLDEGQVKLMPFEDGSTKHPAVLGGEPELIATP